MKRLSLSLILMVAVLFLAGVRAVMQEALRPQLGGRDDLTQKAGLPEALPQSYLNQNRTHKLIINEQETAVYQGLVRADAIRGEVDYGTFKLVIVDEVALGGREALRALPVVMRDDQNMIVLN